MGGGLIPPRLGVLCLGRRHPQALFGNPGLAAGGVGGDESCHSRPARECRSQVQNPSYRRVQHPKLPSRPLREAGDVCDEPGGGEDEPRQASDCGLLARAPAAAHSGHFPAGRNRKVRRPPQVGQGLPRSGAHLLLPAGVPQPAVRRWRGQLLHQRQVLPSPVHPGGRDVPRHPGRPGVGLPQLPRVPSRGHDVGAVLPRVHHREPGAQLHRALRWLQPRRQPGAQPYAARSAHSVCMVEAGPASGAGQRAGGDPAFPKLLHS
mmetsp:Transcript_43008/g.82034  ORF Transcript_43008/g.82034 Transcript_43008/m.82034 type:complete len:263 (-) Transcript_43008:2927-3715(-)